MQLVRERADPLYRQIAARLRYEIVTGRLVDGHRLPSLREAAAEWQVNLHTVRRAYRELETGGFVRTGGGGTRVSTLGPGLEQIGIDLESFVRQFVKQAYDRYSVRPSEIARVLDGLDVVAANGRDTCFLVECSHALSRGLAAEIASRYDVVVTAIDYLKEPLPATGPVIATYFHATELQERLGALDGDMHVVRIRPRESMLAELSAEIREGRRHHLILMDRLPGSAHDLAADFRERLENVTIEVRIISDPLMAFPVRQSGSIVIATPQTWDRLTPELRRRSDVRELKYEIDPADLASLGATLQWAAAVAR